MNVVLVIDGHGAYRHGLRRLLETHFVRSRLIAAESLEEPVLAEVSFDLILIDAASLSHNSPENLQDVRSISPQTRFAVLSSS